MPRSALTPGEGPEGKDAHIIQGQLKTGPFFCASLLTVAARV